MHKEFMKIAINLAKENIETKKGGPFGAVVVKDGNILSQSSNSVTSSNDPTAHAEINAIREACKILQSFDLSGCEIYSSCEPCPMCLSAIYWARVDKLYYAASRYDAAKAGFDDEFIYKELSVLEKDRRLHTSTMMQFEAQEPFDLWIKTSDKTEY